MLATRSAKPLLPSMVDAAWGGAGAVASAWEGEGAVAPAWATARAAAGRAASEGDVFGRVQDG